MKILLGLTSLQPFTARPGQKGRAEYAISPPPHPTKEREGARARHFRRPKSLSGLLCTSLPPTKSTRLISTPKSAPSAFHSQPASLPFYGDTQLAAPADRQGFPPPRRPQVRSPVSLARCALEERGFCSPTGGAGAVVRAPGVSLVSGECQKEPSQQPLSASGAEKKSTTPRIAQPGTEEQVLTRPLGRLSGGCGKFPQGNPTLCLAERTARLPLRKLPVALGALRWMTPADPLLPSPSRKDLAIGNRARFKECF